jgi:hypothetical protein
MDQEAPVIVSRDSAFARDVFVKRHPALIAQVAEVFPFGPDQRKALAELAEENVRGVLTRLPDTAHDSEQWSAWGNEFYGRPWIDVPFLWAESFFYRRLHQAIGYFSAGLWQGVDPFAPFKQTELTGEPVAAELHALNSLSELRAQDQARALLRSSLWGNRADLGFRITAGDAEEGSPLIADDSEQLWELLSSESAFVVLVADNTGRELIPDLVLIDHLLTQGKTREVVLHVKPSPYYVSDATVSDVADCLRRLLLDSGQAREIGQRLRAAVATAQLRICTHPFYCAPFDYTQMPDDLRNQFERATVTILKGDLNYRRLVGDRWWAPTRPFTDVTSYFPGPVATLRILKSDVIVGLAPEKVAQLDASGLDWRTSGTHAAIQVGTG